VLELLLLFDSSMGEINMGRFTQLIVLTVVHIFVTAGVAGAASRTAMEAQNKAARDAASKKAAAAAKGIVVAAPKAAPATRGQGNSTPKAGNAVPTTPSKAPTPDSNTEDSAAAVVSMARKAVAAAEPATTVKENRDVSLTGSSNQQLKGDAQVFDERCIKKDSTMGPIYLSCIRELKGQVGEADKRCQDAFSTFTKANNEFKTSCAEASLGGECRDSIQDCYEKSGGTEFSTLGAAASAFGVQGLGDLQRKCPTMTFDKWEMSHDKLESKMTKAKDGLVDANKEINKAQKQYNETNTKLSKEYNELNKEQAKRALETNSQKRKAAIDTQDAIRKVQEAIFSNSMKIQDLRLQVSTAYIQKASNITAASQGLAMANFKCTDELQQKLSKMGKVSSKAFSNLMANGSSSSNSKKAMWQDCMRAFLKARDQQAQTDAARVEALESQMTNAEETGKYLQDSLKSVQEQADAAKKDMGTADQQEQADYQARVKEIQAAMANNYTESSSTLKTLNENQQRLQEDVTRTSNAFLASESNAPESGSAATFVKASGKFGEMHAAGITAIDACGCDEDGKSNRGVSRSPIASNPLLCTSDHKENPSFKSLTQPGAE
jgi:hypothetical protein